MRCLLTQNFYDSLVFYKYFELGGNFPTYTPYLWGLSIIFLSRKNFHLLSLDLVFLLLFLVHPFLLQILRTQSNNLAPQKKVQSIFQVSFYNFRILPTTILFQNILTRFFYLVANQWPSQRFSSFFEDLNFLGTFLLKISIIYLS